MELYLYNYVIPIFHGKDMNKLSVRDSPYLFVIAMEALSRLLLKSWDGGFISGIKVGGRGGGGEAISHLL